VGCQFTKLVETLKSDKVHYEWFDFHHECRKMKWENLSKLIAKIKDKLEQYGYFLAKFEGGFDKPLTKTQIQVIAAQNGTIRTNCMDCLDRTNVVQSVIERQIAHKQLHKMGIEGEPKGDPFEVFGAEMEEAFRAAWTDNANRVSVLYTGTSALKTDFTRTGKRTFKGALDDGMNAI